MLEYWSMILMKREIYIGIAGFGRHDVQRSEN